MTARARVDFNSCYYGGAFLRIGQQRIPAASAIGDHVAVYDVGAPELGDLDAVVVGFDGSIALLYVFDLDQRAEFNGPDWVEDESLSREETLARFAALHPEPTTGPRTHSGCSTTFVHTWPPRPASEETK